MRSARSFAATSPVVVSAPFLIVALAWLAFCTVFLAVLFPISGPFDLAIRTAIAVVPLSLLIVLKGAGQGRRWGVAATLAVILMVTDLVLRRRGLSETGLDFQTAGKILVWGLGLIVALVNRDRLRVALSHPPVLLFLVFALWCLITTFYSPIKLFSLGSTLSLVSIIIFCAVARSFLTDTELLRVSIGALSVLLVTSLLMYALVPSMALAPMGSGNILRLAAPLGTPNSLGRSAALAVLLSVVGVATGRLRWTSPIVLVGFFSGSACLYLSQSRTATIAVFVALVIVWMFQSGWRVLAAAVGIALTGLVYVFSNVDLHEIAQLISRTGRVKEVATLTGRTDIWAFFWGEISKSPLLGYGYASTKELMPLLYRTFYGFTATHAHNMWLQIWFTTGVVGVILLLTTMIVQARYAWQARDTVGLVVLAFVAVVGVPEAGHVAAVPNVLTVMWVLWLSKRIPDTTHGSNERVGQTNRRGLSGRGPSGPVAR